MIVTQHGKKDPLFKKAVTHNGVSLVFFGWSFEHVKQKEEEWLLANQPVGSKVIEKKRPELRVINGGKVSAA